MMGLKLYWRPTTSLVVILLFSLSISINGNETQPSSSGRKSDISVPAPSPDGESNGNSLLTSRRMQDPALDKQGLLAGPMFLGLASLLFPVLPVLLLAPLAVAGAGPAMNYLQDVFGTQGNQGTGSQVGTQGSSSQAINNFLNQLGSSSGNNDQSTSGSSVSQTIQSLVGNPNGASPSGSSLSQVLSNFGSSSSSSGNQAGSGSSLSQVVQALGFGSSAANEPEPQEGQGSGSLFSGSSSLLNSIFGPDRNSAGSSGLFSGSGSIFGNLGSGSRPVAAYASPNGNKVGQSQQSVGTSDILGAAAAALDNAGLLGPIAGAGSGSVASQLMNLVKPGSGSGSSSSVTSGLSELLGLGEKATQPQTNPILGSSLSSNVVQGLNPHTYGQAQIMNQMANQAAAQTSPSLYGLFGGSSSSSNQGSSITKLTNQALNSISNFIFSKKRSEWIPRPYPEFGYIENAASKAKQGLGGYIKDVFSTFKDGVRRYEIGESECQARLICEMNQKAVGRSFKSWANTVLDLLGVEGYLEKSSFGARTKSVMKDLYRAARSGMHDKDCAVMYSRCPVNIAVEPMRNSVLNKLMSGMSGHSQGQSAHSQGQSAHSQGQQNHGNKHAAIYGPNVQSSGQSAQASHQSAQAQPTRQSAHGQGSLAQKMSSTINRTLKQSPSPVNQVVSNGDQKVTTGHSKSQ